MELLAAQLGVIFFGMLVFAADSVIRVTKPAAFQRPTRAIAERAPMPATAAKVVKVTSAAWSANGPQLAAA